MPLKAAIVSLALVALAGCGDAPPEPGACLHVDGRGGPGADGSPERPFATIADAIAVASAGDEVCLSVGEHVSPGALRVGVTIRGAEPTSDALTSAIVAPAGGCAIAAGLDATDLGGASTVDASAVLITEGDVDVRLERVMIGGCDHALVARARSTVVSGVLVTRARVGVAVDREASASVLHTTIAVVMDLSDDGITCGVCGGTGARIALEGVEVDAGSRGWAVAGAVATLDVEGSLFRRAFAGLALGAPGVRAERVSIGPGTVVTDLAGIALGGDVVTANLIRGAASVEVSGARFESTRTGGLGLQILDADAARIEETQLLGHDYASLALVGGSYVLGEGVVLGATGDGVALIAGGVPAREPGPTSVRVEGALVSNASGAVRHVLVQGTGSLELAGTATLTGGAVGLQARDTGVIDGAGAWTVRDVGGAAVSVTQAAVVTVAGLDARLATGARGIDVADDASLTLLGGTLVGGLFGVHARDRAEVTLTAASFEGGAEAGIVLEGAGVATLTDVEVLRAGLGVAVRGGWRATARDLLVTGSAASGVEVVGATLDLEGGRLEDNRGAAIAFEDGAGAVRAVVFRGTDARADDRADEIRLVATDGMEHVVEIAENMFEIAEGRSCAGGCSVVFASGTGVRGIVRPNCLTATPGVTDTFTLAAQDGGRLEEPAPATWADGLLGRSVDAGWIAGAALTPAAPAILETARVEPFEIPAGL